MQTMRTRTPHGKSPVKGQRNFRKFNIDEVIRDALSEVNGGWSYKK